VLDAVRLPILAALPLVGLLQGPAFASLAWALGACALLSAWLLPRPKPAADVAFIGLAMCFCGLCLLSAAWSIAPIHTALAAGQLTLILAASLVLLADRSISPGLAARAFGAMTLALCMGVAVMCADHWLRFPLQHWLEPRAPYPGTKYDRGEDYLTLLLWPLLAYWTLARHYARALLVTAALLVLAAMGLSTTARVTLPAGFAALLAAWIAPRTTMRVMVWGCVAASATLPLLLRMLAGDRALFWGHLKQSGLHRLEIWDYMTGRVFERPWLGWGFSTAKLVPIKPAELRAFVYVDRHGVYPHNQWLQAWLETGAIGVVVGLAFVLLVLRRIENMPPRLYPFGCAAFAAAVAVSASSFELTTDSWWAALALTALLLRLAGDASLP
jgi:O-antigen ligase